MEHLELFDKDGKALHIEEVRRSALIIKTMTKSEFKQKYFTNNFYWVNKENYKKLQEIALEVGCLCHTGKPEIIEWHDGFKNLGFRTYEKNNNITMFQKEPFLLLTEKATNYDEMIKAYSELS